ncbi:tol-pal system protein YbgF [Rhizobium sp. C4]|uniref:tol-pal system protein YbgF n=1 Tax=Rhizobium sp. C4 TaxID=1349800 RepID=UPI001E643A88|nr:tol-pal system protein YbgF [Rhizobium sp. C4]MCD2174165.1 tol-pal system protein YbgF [Rhizobium sp. C4]
MQASNAEVQIQQLQETVRQLTGRIEDMNFQVLQMQEQLRKTQEDNEFRFQQLEKKPSGKKTELETPAGSQPNKEAAAAAASDTSAATAPAAATTEPRTIEQATAASTQIGEDSVGDTAGIPAASQSTPAADATIANQTAAPAAQPPANAPNEMANMKPGTLGSLIFNGDGRIVETTRNPADNSAETLPGVKPALPPAASGSKPATTAATVPAATTPGAPAAAATKPMEQASITPKASATGAAPTADQSYQQAYQSILSGNYSEAEKGFKSYLDTFPGSAKAADASFWMGEAQYSQGHYNDSAKTFLNAFKSYGQSPKAPDILLKLGMSLAALDNKDTACATFREIPKRYPKASKAVITKVASEQTRLSCPAG